MPEPNPVGCNCCLVPTLDSTYCCEYMFTTEGADFFTASE